VVFEAPVFANIRSTNRVENLDLLNPAKLVLVLVDGVCANAIDKVVLAILVFCTLLDLIFHFAAHPSTIDESKFEILIVGDTCGRTCDFATRPTA
jgi:hypothetical protein